MTGLPMYLGVAIVAVLVAVAVDAALEARERQRCRHDWAPVELVDGWPTRTCRACGTTERATAGTGGGSAAIPPGTVGDRAIWRSDVLALLDAPTPPLSTVTTTTVSTDVRDTPRSIYDGTRWGR